MFVHIVADHQDKISDLRSMFGLQHCVTSSLLNSGDSIPQPCDATIIAADLRTEDNIVALKALSAKPRRPGEGFSSLTEKPGYWKRGLMRLARHMRSSVP